jgi:hypothetical protein
MPRDAITTTDPADELSPERMPPAAKLRHLAEYMETLEVGQVDLRSVHHACGAAHCAWGWGEMIGLFPRAEGEADDSGWTAEMESAEKGRSALLGLTDRQFRHCFGIGYQFRRLGRPYTPSDVAAHLRQTADELERAGAIPRARKIL